jgi:hypothetical protein
MNRPPEISRPRPPVAIPRVYTRIEWGARRPAGVVRYLSRPPDHIVVHHTAGPNTTDYSRAAAFRVSRWLQKMHMDDNGWIDCGQQLTISRGGHIMEGRNLSMRAVLKRHHIVGAQTPGHDEHTIGVENEGSYGYDPVPTALFTSLVQTCAWLCRQYDLDPHEAIVGHRDYVGRTVCPGNVLYGLLPELRHRVATELRSGHA